MTEGLDMSLDDMIKLNKRFRGGGGGRGGPLHHAPNRTSFGDRGGRGGRGGGGFTGPTRRFPDRGSSRSAPYFVPQASHMQDTVIGEESNARPEDGTKLYISNLDYGVSNEDIKVLFSDVGVLKRCSIHYDKSGRSKGTAEVVFVRRSDAVAAMKRYNNVRLDGKPMKLELVGLKIVSPVPVPTTNRAMLGNANVAPRSTQARIFGRGQDRVTHGNREYGRGNGRVRGRVQNVSVEDLDAELDRYHLEAMQIN